MAAQAKTSLNQEIVLSDDNVYILAARHLKNNFGERAKETSRII